MARDDRAKFLWRAALERRKASADADPKIAEMRLEIATMYEDLAERLRVVQGMQDLGSHLRSVDQES
jgi:hypothetical protein